MEPSMVENDPRGCTICRTVSGPFVATTFGRYTVEQDGLPVVTPLILCASTEQREGCVGMLARAAGYVAPDTHGHAIDQYAQVLAHAVELEAEIATRDLRIAELEKKQAMVDDAFAERVADKVLEKAS